MVKMIWEDLDVIFADEDMKQRFLNRDSIFTFKHPAQLVSLVETSNFDVQGEHYW